MWETKTVRRGEEGGLRIGDRYFLGSGCIVIGGVTLGDDCIVGAGVVVTRSFPDGSLIYGRYNE